MRDTFRRLVAKLKAHPGELEKAAGLVVSAVLVGVAAVAMLRGRP